MAAREPDYYRIVAWGLPICPRRGAPPGRCRPVRE